jgi:hypothetical protein
VYVWLATGSGPSVDNAVAAIPDIAWRAVRYPHAFVGTGTGELVPEADVAGAPYVAFAGRPKKLQVTGRLIVRRVKRLSPDAVKAGQGTSFDAWRYHAVFVISRFEMLQAEGPHRDHAVVEQTIADAAAGASATCPAASSPPRTPGRCYGRSRTTSPAPPTPRPAASTPAPPPPRSAPT